MKERRSFSCVVGVSPVACGVRAARCQSRRVLGVSRVVRSHRVVRSLASLRRLSSRVVCRLASSVVSRRRVVCRCQSPRLSESPRLSSVASSRCASSQLLGVSRVVCGVVLMSVASRRASSRCSTVSRVVCGVLPSLRPLSSRVVCASVCRRRQYVVALHRCQSRRVAESCRCQSRLVVRRPAARRLVVRRPAAGVSRVVRSACESRPFFLSFQTRWMTFFFVLY